jgi:hypothetical protein
MNEKFPTFGCAHCGLSRRRFLAAGSAACAGATALLATPGSLRAAQDGAKTRIRIVYSLHGEKQAGPDWPNKGFDFGPVMEEVTAALRRGCPGMEFTTSMASGEEPAKKILEQDKSAGIDGYIVYQMNCWNRVVQTMATSGKPVLYADFQFGGSGGFLTYVAVFLRSGTPNVGFVASSRLGDLIEAAKCFESAKRSGSASDFTAATARLRLARTPKPGDLACKPDPVKTVAIEECLRRMKESKILAIRDQEAKSAAPLMGIPVEYLTFAELNEAWKAADKEEARALVARWEKTADKIEGVPRETLEQSAAMYAGMKAVMKKHGANAITINCLGGFYGGHIHAYPCLGFHELANEGLVGGCECDVRSAATMVALAAMTQGRPGYISDPVIDTAKRQIIYAHCVASNRVFGPQREANPYQILTHSEDRQGASVRSVLPVGYMTTTVQIHPDRKQILFHQGKSVGNDPDDRACRTKLAVEPMGDLEKLFTAWDQWGWHRVTCYGNLKEPVYALANALGWKVLEEA